VQNETKEIVTPAEFSIFLEV